MSRLLVVSHKPCWRSDASPSGFATDGGFPLQMRALSSLFDSTRIVAPCRREQSRTGEGYLHGRSLSVVPLSHPAGKDLSRKFTFPFWLLRNGPLILREILRADVVHTPIPGDVGTIGMLLAFVLRKPLLVRHCGNWLVQRTIAERFWKQFMEKFAGGRCVMLATGGAAEPPSRKNRCVKWIFSTSLTKRDLETCGNPRKFPPGEAIRLFIGARQERAKGTGVIIESLPEIARRYPHVSLDVAGEGAALEELRDLAATLKMNNRVCFHGRIAHSRVLELLRQSHLLCFPTSSSEGFPKIVLEALACGLPVITTRVSVLPQLIGRGCGMLINPDHRELSQAVCDILADPNHYEAMSRSAIETAAQFSLERWTEQIGAECRAAWGDRVFRPETDGANEAAPAVEPVKSKA